MKNFKRVLGPLLLRVHPDLFATHTATVRNANLECVQRMNALGETLEATKPLSPAYSFHCYIKETNSTSSEVLREVKLDLRTPPILTKASNFTSQHQEALGQFLHHFGRLFLEAKLPNPWELSKPKSSSSDATNEGQSSDYWREASLRRAAQVLSEYRMRQTVSSSFRGEVLALRDHTAGRGTVEVDIFIRNGGVLVDAGLSLADEHNAVRRMRDFLIEFAVTLRFDAARWSRVVFILRPNKKLYHCEEMAKRLLVEVPVQFKQGRLLGFIGDHIPQAQLFPDS